jgi:hypothetical protein
MMQTEHMKYLLGVIGRAVTLCLALYIPYALFWQLPIFVGTHLLKNQHTTKACSDAITLCQWAHGGMALFVWGGMLFVSGWVLAFIFVGPKKKVD